MLKRHSRSTMRSLVLMLLLTACLSGLFLFGPVTQHVYAVNNGLARTPPMGWNSWNHYGCNVSDALIRQQADAMVNNGLAAVGYQYVNIDDCWETSRDSSGNLRADPAKFPNGIKALADYIHGKGLKLGIYNDAGTATCAGYPGMYGHEQQDANTYASWGIDYIKVDWCNTSGLDPQTQYTKIGNALSSSGRPIVFSICNWGVNSPWNWGPSIGNLWRTTGDISDNWNSMLGNFDSSSAHGSAAGPGGWNDPDMLEVGNGGMSTTEYQAHFSLWAIEAAPLIAGNDLANMSSSAKTILTNSEVIAVDQDAAGIQGTKVADNGGLQVWSKKLQGNGVVAVALFNRNTSAANITVNWSSIGLSGSASVRDLWAHADQGSFTNSYTANVPAHGVVMLKISGASATYYRLVNRNSGKVLDVWNNSTADGANVIQWSNNGGANQQWLLVQVGSYYKLVNRNSGKVLDVPNGSTENGTALVQWTDNGGTNQQWSLVQVGSYYKLVNRNSGKVLDVPNGSTADGTNVIQWTDNGGTNQQWSLVQV